MNVLELSSLMREFRKMRLNGTQILILTETAAAEETTQIELANTLNTTQASISRSLSSLEDIGLITQLPDIDPRQNVVRLGKLSIELLKKHGL